MVKRLFISVSLLAIKMKLLEPIESFSLETIAHSSQDLVASCFANRMG
jgi:hypothetical protein